MQPFNVKSNTSRKRLPIILDEVLMQLPDDPRLGHADEKWLRNPDSRWIT